MKTLHLETLHLENPNLSTYAMQNIKSNSLWNVLKKLFVIGVTLIGFLDLLICITHIAAQPMFWVRKGRPFPKWISRCGLYARFLAIFPTGFSHRVSKHFILLPLPTVITPIHPIEEWFPDLCVVCLARMPNR